MVAHESLIMMETMDHMGSPKRMQKMLIFCGFAINSPWEKWILPEDTMYIRYHPLIFGVYVNMYIYI
jgi:hypothetical protein